MRIVFLAAIACLVGLPAIAQDNRAATCAVEGSQSPEDAVIACGLVIDAAGSTAAMQQHALLVRAEIRRRLAQLDLAMTDCDEAIRRDPASAQAFDLRGRVRTDAKQYELALDDFDRAIRLDKDLASAFAGRAATFALMRQHRLAVRDYTEAVRLDPRSTQFLADRAAE
jgi:tetratricopeptide (TPR) repeat protein